MQTINNSSFLKSIKIQFWYLNYCSNGASKCYYLNYLLLLKSSKAAFSWPKVTVKTSNRKLSFEIVKIFHIFNHITVTVHTAGRNEEHEDEDKLKWTVFNVDKAGQDKAGQTHRNTGE